MCPVCIAAAIAGSATGTGGLTAFVAHTILRRHPQSEDSTAQKEKPDGHRNAGFETAQNRLAS